MTRSRSSNKKPLYLLFLGWLTCSGCGSGEIEQRYLGEGCYSVGGGLEVSVESSSKKSKNQVLFFDKGGITFHLDSPYFAKKYENVDDVSFVENRLSVAFLEGGTRYVYIIDNLPSECGSSAAMYWTRFRSMQAATLKSGES